MNTFKILYKILSNKEKKGLIMIFFLAVLNSFSELIGIGSLIPFFLAILDPNNPLLIKIYNWLLIDQSNLIIFASITIFTIFTLKFIIQISYIYYSTNLTAKINTRLSYNLYKSYLNQSYEYLTLTNDKGNIFRNLGLVGDVTNNIFNLINFFQAIVLTTFMSIAMIVVDYKISLIIILSITLIIFLYYFLIKPKISRYGDKYYEINKDTIMRIFSAFDSIKTTKIIGNHDFFLNKFHETQIFLNFMNRNKIFIQSIPRNFLEYFFVIGLVLACVYIFYFDNSNNLGVIIFISMGLVRILPQFFSMLHLAINYDYLKKSFFSVFDKKFYQDSKKQTNENSNRIQFRGNIKLENINYSYPNTEESLINNLNLDINSGEIIGIKGASGQGKTTILDLLLGLLEPQTGNVYVNDDKVENIYKKYKNISYVVQEIFITNASLKENIAFGETKIDENKVINSIKLANFNEKFYGNIIKGNLEFELKQMGTNLSAGERQRLNIARAFYFDPKLLILDELTSALDKKNSEDILQSIKNYSDLNQTTVILISHNDDDYGICDKVYELKNKNLHLIKL